MTQRSRAQRHADALVELGRPRPRRRRTLPTPRAVKPHDRRPHRLWKTRRPRQRPRRRRPPSTAPPVGGPGPLAGLRRLHHPDRAWAPTAYPSISAASYRVVPPHLRRAVDHRDHGCVFAGCDGPAPAGATPTTTSTGAHGGDKLASRTRPLCERHHAKVDHGFRIERGSRRPMAHLAARRHRDPHLPHRSEPDEREHYRRAATGSGRASVMPRRAARQPYAPVIVMATRTET